MNPRNSDGINAAIEAIAFQEPALDGGAIILRDGDYTIDATVVM